MKVLTLVFMLALLSAHAATIPQSTSTRVLYASNLGGTDPTGVAESTAAMQQFLNTASTDSQAIHLIIDGTFLVGTNRPGYVPPDAALHLYSNTKITMLPGAKLKLKNGSNCRIICNSCNGYFQYQSNIWVSGYFDCNGQNQSTNENNAPIYNVWPYYTVNGMEFSGIQNFTMENITIHNARSYACQVENLSNYRIENYYRDDDAPSTTLYGMIFGNDGWHTEGNCTNGLIRNLWSNGNDDIIACNLNEVHNQFNVFGDVTLGHYRMNSNFVHMGDMEIDGVHRYADHAGNRPRFEIQVADPVGWIWTNLAIRHMTGPFVKSTDIGGIHFGNLTFEDWNVDWFSNGQLFGNFNKVDNARINGLNFRYHSVGNVGFPLFDVSEWAQVSINNANLWKDKPTDGGSGNEMTLVNAEPIGALNPLVSISGVTASNFTAVASGSRGSVNISGATLGIGTTYTCPGYNTDGSFASVMLEGWGAVSGLPFIQMPTNTPVIGQVLTATGTGASTAWSNAPAGAAPTLIQTNFINGFVYTNLSGRLITVYSEATLATAAVTGTASIDIKVDPNGGRTVSTSVISYAVGTVAAIAADNYHSQIQADIPAGYSYTFTNTSGGAGNSSSLVGAKGFIRVY